MRNHPVGRIGRIACIAASLIAATGVSACHRKVEDPAAVTAEEQAQLNDAAASLDANAVSANTDDPDAPDDNS